MLFYGKFDKISVTNFQCHQDVTIGFPDDNFKNLGKASTE